jgi:hypothetical protein
MDRSQLQTIVEEAFPAYVRLFGLERWKITLEYGRRSDANTKGDCLIADAYNRATIGLDPEEHETAADVLQTLRHEMFHLLHAGFSLFFNMATAGQTDDRLAISNRAYEYSAEQTVVAIETLYAAMLANLPNRRKARA